MKSTARDAKTEEIDVLESLSDPADWIKLPLAIMRDVGPASQTMGGFLKVTNKETFAAHKTIARRAGVPTRTARKHLKTLVDRGWLENRGNKIYKNGARGRTKILAVTDLARVSLLEHGYGVLPCWAIGRFSWSATAVLSIVMGKLLSLKGANEKSDMGFDTWDTINDRMGLSRFEFSLSRIQRETGLSLHAAAKAKRELEEAEVITVLPIATEWDKAQTLSPNPTVIFREGVA